MANAPMIPKIPPLRTDIQEPQQSSAVNRPPAQGVSNGSNTAASNGASPQHRTSKEWYYYWSKVGDQVVQNTQKLNNLVTYGTHAARPDPSTMPDGALYVEDDRGQVLYQNLGGVWYYVAGTFWGTLSPDQRPTDLGASDAGFEFRSVDTNPDLAPRTFVWSQAEWIETTLVTYGTHASRPAPDQKTPPRTLYVEEDRSNVMYQQQANKWMYVAGTMWGTLSPDQRPTDLGVNDAGFQFRGTDQQRAFIWSGAAWVDVTPPPANNLQFAAASGNVSLTTAAQAVPGTTLTLPNNGVYLIVGVFYFLYKISDSGNSLNGNLNPAQAASATVITAGSVGFDFFITASQQWTLTVSTAPMTINLTASKGGGTGTSETLATSTTISALFVG